MDKIRIPVLKLPRGSDLGLRHRHRRKDRTGPEHRAGSADLWSKRGKP